MNKVAFISDIHYCPEYAEEIISELKSVVERIQKMQVKNLYILGDLIMEQNEDKDIENIKKVRDILEGNGFNCKYIPGNHDVVNINRKQFRQAVNQERLYGQDNLNKLSIIYLDTTVENKVHGLLNRKQIKWLKNSVRESNRNIILSHHSFVAFPLNHNKWFRDNIHNAVCRNLHEVNEILLNNQVEFCLSGHIHQDDYIKHDGIDRYSLQAFARRIPESYKTDNHIRYVTGNYSVINEGNDKWSIVQDF